LSDRACDRRFSPDDPPYSARYPKAARRVLGAGAIIGVTIAVYIPAMRSGFVWDDDTFLTENPLIKAPDGLYRFWFTTEAPDYFPLTSSLLWIEWRLWGRNPTGYHVVNVVLHAVGAVLLWTVLVRLRIPGAWWAAMLFAVHPVNVESVAWITERKNVLPMVFYALTLWLFLKFRADGRHRWYILAVPAFLLALLSKTSVVMLPIVLLGCAAWQDRGPLRKDLFQSIPFFILAGVLGSVTVWFQYTRAIGEDVVRNDGFMSRLAVAGIAVWFYLYKALLPHELCFVYPRWQIDASNPLSYVPGLLLAALLGVLWRFRSGWGRAPLFALGYYVVMLFPVLGFFNIYFMRYSLVADHWQYFSIIGIIALLTGVGARVFASRSTGLRVSGIALASGAVGLLGFLTWRQAGIYTDHETLWRDTLRKNPRCAMAHNNLGSLLERRGQFDQATHHYAEAVRIEPNFAEAHNHLGSMRIAQGRIDQAIAHYVEAIRIKPHYADAHNNLGVALSKRGDMGRAFEHYQRALGIRPDHVEAQFNLGVALTGLGRLDQAAVCYGEVLRLDPNHVKAHNNLAMLLAKRDRTTEAIAHYERAITLQPDWPEPLNNLAWLLATHPDAKVRRGAEAVELARKACALTRHEQPEFLDTLAAGWAEAGRFDQAIAVARQAIELATRSGLETLAGRIRERLRLYESSRPFREGPS